jgi:acetyl-CoA acetyltransferase
MRENLFMPSEPFIVGAGETAYRRRPGSEVTSLRLLAEAARLALDDAGMVPEDVDGLGVSSFSLAPDRAIDLAFRLGLRVSWLMDAATGGASALDMLQHARRAVEAGDATSILLVAGDRIASADFAELVDGYNTATRDHLAPIPTAGPNALFALLTRRHMLRHGLGRDVYGGLVVRQRAWASRSPNAAYRAPLELHDYLRAPMVADPLCIFDCVPVVSGAAAVVVTSRGTSTAAVGVKALAAAHNADNQEGDGLSSGLAGVRERLWDEAGCRPVDLDVVAVYDDYPAMVLVQLEDLGFAAEGVESLARRIADGELPVNTSGGQLSGGQAGAGGGMLGLVEVVRQLRGRAGERQVADARLGLVTGYGMVAYRHGACANAAVLERVR